MNPNILLPQSSFRSYDEDMLTESLFVLVTVYVVCLKKKSDGFPRKNYGNTIHTICGIATAFEGKIDPKINLKIETKTKYNEFPLLLWDLLCVLRKFKT